MQPVMRLMPKHLLTPFDRCALHLAAASPQGAPTSIKSLATVGQCLRQQPRQHDLSLDFLAN
jgi:hypothetical protein